jgi:uncharacterized membrane protein YbhN (UPF0104 family)
MNGARRLARAVRRLRVTPFAISALLLGALVWWGAKHGRPPLPEEAAELAALFAALSLYGLATVVRGERWHRLLRAGDIDATRRESLELTAVGYMGNNILPARAGELLRVLLAASRTGASRARVLGTVFTERALDALVLAALLFAFATGAVPGAVERGAALVVLAFAAVLVAVIAIGRSGGGGRPRWLAAIAAKARELAAATQRLRGPGAARLVVVSVVVWIVEAAVYLLVGDALGLHLGALDAISIMVFANLAALVPAGPGYLGTFDAAVVLSLGSLGVDYSAAVGYLLVLRFVLFVPITIAGLLVFVTRYAGWGALRSADLRVTRA